MAAAGPTSNFPNGITSWGVPVIDGALARAAARGADVYWVDPRIGSDSFSGKSPSTPFATVTQAESKLEDESGDVVFYVGNDGTTGSSSRDTATITWDKSGCALIGLCTPVPVSQRCRIAPSTSFAGALLDVTGHNNIFANFQLFQGHNAASTCLELSGQRNQFWNVHVAGIGHATAGDDAASESLLIDGGSENLFERCTIGLDTIARSAACAEIRVTTAATRNYFKDCHITSYADNAGALHVDIPDSAGMDRYVYFEDCRFTNSIDSAATQMTVSMNIHATCGGTVYLIGAKTLRYGATDWAASFVNLCQLGLNSGTAATDMGAGINGS